MKVLTVGDCHVTNDQDLSRFDLLGKLIVDQQPEVIVIMGDFLTFNCLSFWDRDKRKKMEGQRYILELNAGNEALDRMLFPKNTYNNQLKKKKKRLYEPRIIYLEGNHEDRLERYLDTDPTFDGMVGVRKDLRLDERGIEFIPYREYINIKGVDFTHIPFGKAKEIGGLDITRKAQAVTVRSCVFAHTHELHVGNCHKRGQDHLQQVINVGCFFEVPEDYVKGRMTNYWKGLVLLHIYKDERFDIETFSIGRMRRMYGQA